MGILWMRVSNPIYIYPWGNAHGVIIDAMQIIENELRKLAIDVRVRDGQGPAVFSGNHVNGRGWWDGSRIFLHSGKVRGGPGYQAPFRDANHIGMVLLHEWMHSQGWQHSNGGTMDPIRGSWPAPWEVKWFKQRFGEIADPLQQLRQERHHLIIKRNEIMRRIAEIDKVLNA